MSLYHLKNLSVYYINTQHLHRVVKAISGSRRASNRDFRRVPHPHALTYFTAIASLLLASLSHARLSESESQLVERYAKPIMRSPESIIEQGKILSIADNLHFKSGDWHVLARMTGGKCESITYSKPGEWTEDQFRHVLESNGGRALWEERMTATPKMHRTWLRRDGTTAVWRMLQGFTLSTPAFDRARDAVKKRAKEDASKLPKI